MSYTADQKTNTVGFPKPAEIIEISGAHALEASDRAALNVLYQHAHDSGRLIDPSAEFSIELARLRPSKHESNDRVRDSLDRLMRVIVNVPYVENEEERILKTHLFDFFDLPATEGPSNAILRFGIPKKLVPILARSGRWGRIKAEIVCAMTSKYAMALYEQIQLRANLDRCVETFSIERFRDMLNVPPGKLMRGPDFTRFVLEPAALEVNGLSDFGVKLEPVRKHAKAPMTAVTVAWWRKEGEEYRAALRERQRPKVGRMARLRGTVEGLAD